MASQKKRVRFVVTVDAGEDTMREIDGIVDASGVRITRAGVALAAIRAGLPTVRRELGGSERKRRKG